MTLSLTNAQLDQIVSTLFICKDPATTKLPKPTDSTGALSLAAKLDKVGADPRYAHLGIGIVDLGDPANPKIWMHNAGDTWRIASVGKLAMLLAAVQLRDDVRWLFQQGFIKTAQDGDDLFAMHALWRRAKNPVTAKLAKTKRPPRVSTIFDFTRKPPEFIGQDMRDPTTRQEVVTDIATASKSSEQKAEMPWSFATQLGFSERMWLAGARSDNVAASTCVSEIGVAYIKAVQAAYGLFDVAHGMTMLLADGYSEIDTRVAVDAVRPKVKYRSLEDRECVRVRDGLFVIGKGYKDRLSAESGNVLALMAFMIAWRQNKLVSPEACDIITNNLGDKTGLTSGSGLIDTLPSSQVQVESTKIGVLDARNGEQTYLDCEFAYAEVTPPFETRLVKYGAVVTGIRPGSTDISATDLTALLGFSIFSGLAF